MEAITDLKHILHRGRDKYMTKNDGDATLVGYFSFLYLLNRITIKLHLIEKTNSTIISIPFVFSHVFTSNRTNIFYHAIFNNRLKLTKLQFKLKKLILNRSISTCLDKGSNCGENAIVKNIVKFKERIMGLKFNTDLIHGFSNKNLRVFKLCQIFYRAVHDNLATSCSQIGQQAVAQLKNSITKQVVSQLCQIPWGHNLKIISKCQTVEEALYYVTNTQQNGWSRSVLEHQIENGLWKREGKTIDNFTQTLPNAQSDLAKQTIKDPYIFDFLTLTKDYTEHELEQGLVKHTPSFLRRQESNQTIRSLVSIS